MITEQHFTASDFSEQNKEQLKKVDNNLIMFGHELLEYCETDEQRKEVLGLIEQVKGLRGGRIYR